MPEPTSGRPRRHPGGPALIATGALLAAAAAGCARSTGAENGAATGTTDTVRTATGTADTVRTATGTTDTVRTATGTADTVRTATGTADTVRTATGTTATGTAARWCGAAFGDRLLGWSAATVGELRAYRYGGPVAHVPLRAAFPEVAASAPAAWCLARGGGHAATLWGLVPGRPVAPAITVVGPDRPRPVGPMDGPPRVP